jgi:hypothetical protein
VYPSFNFFQSHPSVKIFQISKIPFISLRKKNYKDLGVIQDLIEFAQIPTHESLKKQIIYIYFLK